MIFILVILLVLVVIGIPIGYSLGISGSLYFLIYQPGLLALVPERLFSGFNAPLLLALPLFTFMGLLMNEANLTRRLINLLMLIVGRIRGALGLVNVLVSMVFGGISGSSVSDTASVGSILIPEMQSKGYSCEFACGVTVASSTMGMVIPPSIPMLLYACISSQSVGKLFMGGLIPGVMVGLFMCIITFIKAKKENIPIVKVKLTKKYAVKTLKDGILALIMPLIVIGAIIFGITTATEAAAIGGLYALVVGVFVYKSLTFKSIVKILKQTIKLSAAVMIVVAFSKMFTWILTLEAVPQAMLTLVSKMNLSATGLMLCISVIILFVGMFLDVSPAIMLLTPVFLPAAMSVGVSPIQFGVLLIVGTAIGLATPPVGMCLNVASGISKRSIFGIFKSAAPFLLANVGVMLLVSLVPGVSTWLSGLI